MKRFIRRLSASWAACALALLVLPSLPIAHAATPAGNRATAIAFVHELAQGKFTQARTRFDAQMRLHATPAQLKKLWQFMQKEFGTYGKTEGSNTVNMHGHQMVIVHTHFERQSVGLAVFFDSAQRIDGLHVVPIRTARHTGTP